MHCFITTAVPLTSKAVGLCLDTRPPTNTTGYSKHLCVNSHLQVAPHYAFEQVLDEGDPHCVGYGLRQRAAVVFRQNGALEISVSKRGALGRKCVVVLALIYLYTYIHQQRVKEDAHAEC
jgi:hypothetical protein